MSRPLRILILEDNAADAELNLHELRRAGFDPQWTRVETEADFLAALDTAPELILADYSLPKFDGLSALKLLRDRGLDIPFILVSGQLGEETAVEAMKQGANDYLLKDRIARLGTAVERALEEKRLRAEKQEADEKIRASLREKEVLLTEVHHRVKNNLQIISSLLNLQSRRITDLATLKILASTSNRVRAMAAVHERLYESGDFGQIDFAAHLGSLVRNLMRAHAPADGTVRPELKLEPVTVELNTAVPLSLIANELITNALKYAFPEGAQGTLTITLRAGETLHEMCVADDGPGFPAGIDPASSRALGLRLVRDLVRQIRGELDIASAATGTAITVRWAARPAFSVTASISQEPIPTPGNP